MSGNFRNFALWVIIALLMLALFTLFQNPGMRPNTNTITFSQLLNDVDGGRVRDVVIQGSEIHGTRTDGRAFHTYHLPNDPTLLQRLYGKGVTISVQPSAEAIPWFVSLLVSWLPFIVLIGVWIFLSRQTKGVGSQMSGFGHSTATSRNEIEGLKRQIADLQAQIDRLNAKDK